MHKTAMCQQLRTELSDLSVEEIRAMAKKEGIPLLDSEGKSINKAGLVELLIDANYAPPCSPLPSATRRKLF